MDIRYSSKSSKDLKRISRGDKKSAEMIIKEIERYAQNLNDYFDIKYLKGPFGDLKRLRVGNYRVIFDDENSTLSIYRVYHRQEAYS